MLKNQKKQTKFEATTNRHTALNAIIKNQGEKGCPCNTNDCCDSIPTMTEAKPHEAPSQTQSQTPLCAVPRARN